MVPMADEPRDIVFKVRMSTSEREMLDELSQQMGISASDVVRLLLRDEHARRKAAAPGPRRRITKGFKAP